jgi:hypothetical protein
MPYALQAAQQGAYVSYDHINRTLIADGITVVDLAGQTRRLASFGRLTTDEVFDFCLSDRYRFSTDVKPTVFVDMLDLIS